MSYDMLALSSSIRLTFTSESSLLRHFISTLFEMDMLMLPLMFLLGGENIEPV